MVRREIPQSSDGREGGPVTAGGILLILAGVWLATQVLAGDFLARLGLT